MPPYGKQIGFFKQKTLRPFFYGQSVFFTCAYTAGYLGRAFFAVCAPLIVQLFYCKH